MMVVVALHQKVTLLQYNWMRYVRRVQFPQRFPLSLLTYSSNVPTVQITLSTLGEIAALQKTLVGGDGGWRRWWVMVMVNGGAVMVYCEDALSVYPITVAVCIRTLLL